jgi:hypothetical protein
LEAIMHGSKVTQQTTEHIKSRFLILQDPSLTTPEMKPDRFVPTQ